MLIDPTTSIIPTTASTPIDPITPAVPGGAVEPIGTPTVDPTAEPEPQFDRAHGMLRKLIAGGFNAVAAARHQAKFATELKQAGITLPEPAAMPGRAARITSRFQSSEPSQPTLDQAA